MTPHRDSWIDRSAMSLSGLCLIHCLAGSVLLAGLSATGGFWSHSVHVVGLGIALPLAAFGLVRGVRRHRRVLVLALGGIGLSLMAGSLLLPHGRVEIALSITGVALLAAAHLLNLRWSRG